MTITQGRAKHPVKFGCIHCSATRATWMDGRPIQDKKAEIKRWHLDRQWKDIGYHWLIDRDGSFIKGRNENVIGAGVKGHNRGVIHVCLLGGHGSSATDLPLDNFTEPQMAKLREIMGQIEKRTGPLKWTGHNEHANKACPGFSVPMWLAGRQSPPIGLVGLLTQLFALLARIFGAKK